MSKLQRITIIIAAFGIVSLLLSQTNSYSFNPTPHRPIMPVANVNISPTMVKQHAVQDFSTDTETLRYGPNIVTNIYQSQSGSFYFEQAEPSSNTLLYESANLQSTQAEITITGPIARTRLTQVFSNTSEQIKSGVYVFPLPQDAAVDTLIMQVGKREIKGIIKRKEIANKMFSQAKSEGKSATLMTQLRPNMFTNHIANIEPQSTIKVTIEYQQFVVQDQHNYALRLPLSITPRYAPSGSKAESSPDLYWNNEVNVEGKQRLLGAKTQISVRLNTGLPINHITSENHPIKTNNPFSTQYEIELDTSEPVNKDFVLNWQLRPSQKIQASHFNYIDGTYEYGLITLLPPEQDKLKAKRNVVFILDVSGSMVGEAIMQAKQSLALAINALEAEDFFNLVIFSSEAKMMWSSSQSATAEARENALNYIYNLEANGGTEIKKALDMALALPVIGADDAPYLNQLIFITDGSVSNEDEIMQTIYQDLGEYRLFTVGIGNAPNAYFMTEAATAGKGTYTFISDASVVKPKMQRLLDKLKKPALTDIKLNIKNTQPAFAYEVYPSILPDLYEGEPLVITYRKVIADTSGTDNFPFSLEGKYLAQTENGKTRRRSWSRELPSINSEREQGIQKHWARLKIKDLHQQLNMKGRFNDDYNTIKKNVTEAITNVALRHHLVSQYTSLIAIDSKFSEFARDSAITHKNLTQYALAQLPKTATPSLLFTLLGFLLTIIGGAFFLLNGKRL